MVLEGDVYAWGAVTAAGAVSGSSGVKGVTRPATGVYDITLLEALAPGKRRTLVTLTEAAGRMWAIDPANSSPSVIRVTIFDITPAADNAPFEFVVLRLT